MAESVTRLRLAYVRRADRDAADQIRAASRRFRRRPTPAKCRRTIGSQTTPTAAWARSATISSRPGTASRTAGTTHSNPPNAPKPPNASSNGSIWAAGRANGPSPRTGGPSLGPPGDAIPPAGDAEAPGVPLGPGVGDTLGPGVGDVLGPGVGAGVGTGVGRGVGRGVGVGRIGGSVGMIDGGRVG